MERKRGRLEHVNEARQRLPEDLELTPPGPQLATLLAAVDRRRLSGRDRLRLAQARNRLVARQQAQLLEDLYAVTLQEPPAEAEVRPEQASRYPWAETESRSRCGGPAPPPATGWNRPGS